jgi:hypothetical protein
MKRRICWPTLDAVCLEGGCVWCNDNPFFRSVSDIPDDDTNRIKAFGFGKRDDWHNAETRKS